MLRTFKRMWNITKNRHKSLISALILVFLRSSIIVTEIAAIMITLNSLIANDNNPINLYVIIGLTLACVLGTFIFSYFDQIESMRVGSLSIADKRMDIGNKLMDAPLGYIKGVSPSSIITTLTTTSSGLEMSAPMLLVVVVAGAFNSLALTIFMLIYDYRIGLLTLLGMIIYLLLVAYQMKLSRRNAYKLSNAQNNLTKATLAFIKGIKVTKSNSYNEGDMALKEAIRNSKVENVRLTDNTMPYEFLSSLAIAIFEGAILILSLYLLLYVGDISISKAIILMIFSFMAYQALNQAGGILSMIGLVDEGLIELERLDNLDKLRVSKPYLEPTSNDIALENVCFSYGDNEILHNINMEVKENSLTAIIGPSGSGKTTLCELISRFIDSNSGAIKIGGVDIRNIKYENLMKRIAFVFQSSYLFEDTILNNIKFARPSATADEVIEASKRAACHDFIMSLPKGYDTLVSEAGSSLSGGERQRIAIARAILKDSPIIILDEATASLDNDNEALAMRAISELTKNKTVIMVAHRLDAIKNADQIVVLDKGRIAEVGSASKLKEENGIYKHLLEIRERILNFEMSNK